MILNFEVLLCARARLIYVAIIGRDEKAELQTLFQAHAVNSWVLEGEEFMKC